MKAALRRTTACIRRPSAAATLRLPDAAEARRWTDERNLCMNIKRDRLLNFLLGWLLFSAALPTLIVYRAALQPKYRWDYSGLWARG